MTVRIVVVPRSEMDAAIFEALATRLVVAKRMGGARRWEANGRLFIHAGGTSVLHLFDTGNSNSNSSSDHDHDSNEYDEAEGEATGTGVFSLVGPADRSHFSTAKSVLVRGTPALSALVARMRNVWLPRQTAAIDGIQLRRNHLCVRIGRVSIGASPRGIFIQLVSVGGRHVDLHPRSQTDLDPDQTTSRIGATLDTDAESDAAALEIDSIVADLKQCVAEILPELPLAEYSHDANEQAMLHELAAQGQTGNAEVHLMIKALRFQSIL